MKGSPFCKEMPREHVDLMGAGQETNPPAGVCLTDLSTVLAIPIMNHHKLYEGVFQVFFYHCIICS